MPIKNSSVGDGGKRGISQAICPERDLTCVLPVTSTAGKVPRAISRQGVR